jgi:hypothetical protein
MTRVSFHLLLADAEKSGLNHHLQPDGDPARRRTAVRIFRDEQID